MRVFTYDALPIRVVFGAGTLTQLPDEVGRLGLANVLVLSTPGQHALGQRLVDLLGPLAAGLHAHAKMHVPADVAAAAVAEATRINADGIVVVGGGSAVGLGKIVARDLGLPVVAVPTTYAGSEMTPIWGLTEDGVKTTARDPKVLPRTVIYDPELTVGLPPGVSATSGMNAMAHAVEALYAPDANPIASTMAEQSIAALARGLPRVVADPADLDARGDALYGAWLAGVVLGTVGIGLHHKLCHTLGGTFDLSHADVHTVILPHAAAYNAAAAPDALARVAAALGVSEAPGGLYDLAKNLGAPTGLAAIGMPESGLDRAADLAVAKPYPNPAPVTRDGVRVLLESAFHGRRP
jgi:alcohol dehydrogenase class IV